MGKIVFILVSLWASYDKSQFLASHVYLDQFLRLYPMFAWTSFLGRTPCLPAPVYPMFTWIRFLGCIPCLPGPVS